jgi:hypothetical protein
MSASIAPDKVPARPHFIPQNSLNRSIRRQTKPIYALVEQRKCAAKNEKKMTGHVHVEYD